MIDELIEILVEEPSMKNFLTILLPKILPEKYRLNVNCFIREHIGKQHLMKSIPIKTRAYLNYKVPVRVIIIRDQDTGDCIKIKGDIISLVDNKVPSLVRIACRELEAWYLGDMNAIQSVYPIFKAEKYRNWAKFRNPDLCNASTEIKLLIPGFQKGYASKEIPKFIEIEKNRSTSFNNMVTGVIKFLNMKL